MGSRPHGAAKRPPATAPSIAKITGGFVPKPPPKAPRKKVPKHVVHAPGNHSKSPTSVVVRERPERHEIPVAHTRSTPLGQHFVPPSRAEARAARSQPYVHPKVPKLHDVPGGVSWLGAPIPSRARLSWAEGLGRNASREAGQIAKGLMPAAYTFGKASVHDLTHRPRFDESLASQSQLYRDIVKPMGTYYNQRYVQPLRHGEFGQVAHSAYEQPLSFGLDTIGAAALPARVGSIGTGIARTGSIRAGIRESYYPAKARTLTKGKATVQLPMSRHPLVRWAQDIYDSHGTGYLQRATGGRVGSLEKRIGKYGAREEQRALKIEKVAGANVARAVAKLGRGGIRRKLSFDQVGHDPARVRLFWLSQVPAEFRNNETLTLIQNDLAYGLRNASGRMRRQIQRTHKQLEQAKKVVETPEYQRALSALEELTTIRQDIFQEAFGSHIRYMAERPMQKAEAEARVAELDAKYNGAVDALASKLSLSIDPQRETLRRNYLNSRVGVGKHRGRKRLPTVKQEIRDMAETKLLDLVRDNPVMAEVQQMIATRQQLREALNEASFGGPEDFGNVPTGRTSLEDQLTDRRKRLAEHLGLPGDPGVYLHHTMTPLNSGRVAIPRAPYSGVVGETSRQGTDLGHRLELRLYEQAELLPDPDLAIQSWSKAQSIQFLNRVKQFLHDVSEPIDAELGPKRGAYLVNREGKALPESWKRAEEDDDFLPKSAQEYLNSFLTRTDSETEAPFIRAAGGLENVRQVDPKIVHAFYLRLGGGARGAFGADVARQFADVTNGLVKMSLLYLNPAYIPANLMGNLAFGALHQGALLPANLLRAALIRTRNPELWNRISAQVGMGPTVAIAGEPVAGGQAIVRALRKGEQRVAQTIGGLPDNWPRAAAWIHEARKAGFNTEAKQSALLDAAEHTPEARLRTEIGLRSNNAMVDFERLAPWEKDSLAKVFFVWPWVRGATAWAGHYAKHYPERSSLVAQQAQRSQAQNEQMLGGIEMPSWLEGSIILRVNGRLARIRRTTSLSPSSTVLGMGETAAGLWNSVRYNKPFPKYQTVWDMTNPIFDTAIRLAYGKDEHGQDLGFWDNLHAQTESLVPQYRLTKKIIAGPQKGKTTRNTSRWEIAQQGLLRGSAETIDLSVIAKQTKQAHAKTAADYEKGFVQRYKKVFKVAPDTSIMRDLRNKTLFNLTKERLKKSLGLQHEPNERQQTAIMVGIYFQQYPQFAAEWGDSFHTAVREGSPPEVHKVYLNLSKALGLTDLEKYSGAMTKYEDAQDLAKWNKAHGK